MQEFCLFEYFISWQSLFDYYGNVDQWRCNWILQLPAVKYRLPLKYKHKWEKTIKTFSLLSNQIIGKETSRLQWTTIQRSINLKIHLLIHEKEINSSCFSELISLTSISTSNWLWVKSIIWLFIYLFIITNYSLYCFNSTYQNNIT